MFQGNCYTCGQWGHSGKFCPKGNIGEVGQGEEGTKAEEVKTEGGKCVVGGISFGGSLHAISPIVCEECEECEVPKGGLKGGIEIPEDTDGEDNEDSPLVCGPIATSWRVVRNKARKRKG